MAILRPLEILGKTSRIIFPKMGIVSMIFPSPREHHHPEECDGNDLPWRIPYDRHDANPSIMHNAHVRKLGGQLDVFRILRPIETT